MTGANAFTIASATTLPAQWRGYARVEKASLSNNCDGERRDSAQDHGWRMRPPASAKLSRIETTQPATDYSTRRLVPAFVTQVLAQVTPEDARDFRPALAAYRETDTGMASVFDRQV